MFQMMKEKDILDKVHDYMVEIEGNTIFTETDMLYNISKKLGIADKIAKYERINSDAYEMIMNDLNDEFLNILYDSKK